MKKLTISLILISGLFLAGCSQQSTDTNEVAIQSGSDQIAEQSGQAIDLTNCTSYYDWCNNCMVESGKVTACTLMYCEKQWKPTCLQHKQPEQNQTQSTEEPTICTMEYAPVCAKVSIQCIKAPCEPIKETFGNKCQMNANKLATFLHDGECEKSK